MSILTIIAALIGSNWSTTCVMTQAEGLQGYTIDRIVFQNKTDVKKIDVTFTRIWFLDQNCKEQKTATETNGTLIIGNRLNQNTFEADWLINGKTELGAISLSDDQKSLRTATTSFGSMRNTMLSLFAYTAK